MLHLCMRNGSVPQYMNVCIHEMKRSKLTGTNNVNKKGTHIELGSKLNNFGLEKQTHQTVQNLIIRRNPNLRCYLGILSGR